MASLTFFSPTSFPKRLELLAVRDKLNTQLRSEQEACRRLEEAMEKEMPLSRAVSSAWTSQLASKASSVSTLPAAPPQACVLQVSDADTSVAPTEEDVDQPTPVRLRRQPSGNSRRRPQTIVDVDTGTSTGAAPEDQPGADQHKTAARDPAAEADADADADAEVEAEAGPTAETLEETPAAAQTATEEPAAGPAAGAGAETTSDPLESALQKLEAAREMLLAEQEALRTSCRQQPRR